MTKQSKFGSRCELSEKFLSEETRVDRGFMPLMKSCQVATCGVVDLILMAAMAKSKVDLGKKLKVQAGQFTSSWEHLHWGAH